MFKSAIQPLCRACGKPIAKRTSGVLFGCTHVSTFYYRTEKPLSIAVVRTFFNEQVVSVSWRKDSQGNKLYIDGATIWDGETYEDEYFHSNVCAVHLARACASAGRALTPYNDAIEARRQSSVIPLS